MRALLLAVLLAGALAVLSLAPATTAHGPARCDPPFAFPSLALWNVPAGGTSSFWLPSHQFGSLVSSLPVDVTMFRLSTCALDASCHHHGVVGPFACGSTPASILEIHNPNSVNAPVALAIGICFKAAVCDAL